MEKVISLLYDIEEKANQIVTRARDEKISLNKALEDDLAKLDQKTADETAAKLNLLKAQVDIESAKELQALIDDCDKQLAAMDTNYQENHTAIVDKIFQSIITP